MKKTLTFAAIGFIFSGVAAVAGDGHKDQKTVYNGLLPSQTFTSPLEGRSALYGGHTTSFDGSSDRRAASSEGQANIRIQSEYSARSLAGYGS